MISDANNSKPLDKTAVMCSNIDYENVYTNKKIRNWWLTKTEEDRRAIVRKYFKGGNSESINTLYGIMPEELEEMYLENSNEINKFILQTSKDYDMKYTEVELIKNKYPDDFYKKLEEFISERKDW